MIWYGIISEVQEDKARVAVGDLSTDYLPVFQFASDYKRRWEPIKEKEQCVIFSPSGDINGGCIIRGLYRTMYPAPGNDPETEITEYSDGTTVSYCTKGGKNLLKIDAVKDITVICGETITVLCTDAFVTAKKSIVAECETAELTAKKSIKADCETAELTAKKSIKAECMTADLTAQAAITAKCLTADITATTAITAKCATAEVTAMASARLTSPQVTVDSKAISLGVGKVTGVVTQECICTLTGLPHPEASKIVLAIKEP